MIENNTSLHAFYTGMNRRERRTFWACFSGWGLDGFDFMIYPLIISTIISLWQISPGKAGLATTVTLLASAFGGWAAGYLSDRVGRVLTLQITIAWFAICTLLCSMSRTFDQLLLFRALLGFGFGGEWAAGSVLMGEIIRAEFRGRALGSVQSAWAIGWVGAVVLQVAMFSIFDPQIAWRAMFFVGFIPGAILIYYIRRKVTEPDIAMSTRSARSDMAMPTIWEIFSAQTRRRTVLASIAMIGAHGGYYSINTWLPAYLQTERGLTAVGSGEYLAFLILGSFVGYLVGAWLADRVGRRILFLIFSIGAIATVLMYTQLPTTDSVLLLVGLPLGFFTSGYLSGIGAFLTELFPTHLRGSAQGFCYNAGRGIGSLFPMAVGIAAPSVLLGNSIAIFAVVAYSMFFLAAFALPETRGVVLSAD